VLPGHPAADRGGLRCAGGRLPGVRGVRDDQCRSRAGLDRPRPGRHGVTDLHPSRGGRHRPDLLGPARRPPPRRRLAGVMAAQDGPWRPPAQTERDDTEPTPPPPDDIHTAWVLWMAAAGFALVGMLLNALTSRFEDMPAATREVVEDAAAEAGDAEPSIDGGIRAGLADDDGTQTVRLAFRTEAGKGWARTLLDLAAIVLVVVAVSVVVGWFGGMAIASSGGEVVTFVAISGRILAGVCAAAAV